MNNFNFRILIVDDEPNIRSGLAKGLTNDATAIAIAERCRPGSEALSAVRLSASHCGCTTELRVNALN